MPDRKTLVLTGASRGIGHATVKHFTAAGWRVLSVSRYAWTPECPWAEGAENHIRMDLSDISDVVRGIGKIRGRLKSGRIEALVDDAGISPKNPDGRRLGVLDTGHDTWLRVFNVNLFSVASLARGLFDEPRAGAANRKRSRRRSTSCARRVRRTSTAPRSTSTGGSRCDDRLR
jgi:NAD(P)-dependent dehydrogenase (short-subunit alcohol dehydrogenase family)